MNKFKRFCALLLAIVLVLGAVLPSGIGGVFAGRTEQTGQIAEPMIEPDAEPTIESIIGSDADGMAEPVIESMTESESESESDSESASELTTESALELTADLTIESISEVPIEPTPEAADESMTAEPMEPTAERMAEAADESMTELLIESMTEAATESPTESASESMADLTIESMTEVTIESMTEVPIEPITEVPTEPMTEVPTEPATEAPTEPITEAPTEPATELLTEPSTELAIEPTTELLVDSMTESEGETEPAGDVIIVLPFYEQLMTCGSLAEFEALLCAEENAAALDALTQEELQQLLAYVEELYAGIEHPTEADTLLKEELQNKLNEHIIVICPECGEANGHAPTCSQYVASYSWAELTDAELAAWLMDEANADLVRTILTSDSEEAAALNLRIEAILDGEDTELAQQLQEYLAALLGTDEPEVLAENNEYIYFDLAAGNVTIGKDTYNGKVFVDGVETQVTGKHVDGNRYYIYQSNPNAEESSSVHPKNTGYATETDFKSKSGCRVPHYDRVKNEGKLWTEYVTNNTDVKMVSNAWAAAADKFGRTGTVYYINFVKESGYTADVTIDNIWSTYHLASVDRKNGGIGAHLDDQKDTTIRLRLKGDNRVGCVHYSSDKGSGNQIIFDNGETVDAPGSITVADFPQNFKANHWNSAIGAADNPANTGDMSDGIVINSGVIFAGTTPEDNCTAIGGGGNNYGGVTINGGTVTAVVSSTGTAIGGGIGYGNKGGDTDVIINDGTVYAYNLGIQSDAGDGFTKFVPAAAIGGGGSKNAAGSLTANITITGGTVYAQSMGGAAIGGGCSANADGGPATINISGGTIIAKSTGGNYGNEKITPGVSIGGGTGKTRGGSVILNVSEKNSKQTILRTGSIGGGLATDEGAKIGNAKVTISGGDITGQVIMAAGANEKCEFQMTGGRIHGTDVVNGNDVEGVRDPKPDVKIEYLEKNGGAVWMQDPIGVTDITGGTIEECSAYLGGAVYMEGGTFTLSGTGKIQKNKAKRIDEGDEKQGYGGGVYISNGDAAINGGSINENTADIRGGGLYVNGGDVDVFGGSICKNEAGINQTLTQVGRGGGVYLEDGNFTMTGGEISDNSANYRGGGIFLTKKPTLTAGTISGNKATDSGGGLCINGDELELVSPNMQIFGNTAANGGGVAVLNGNFILNGGAVGVEEEAANETENGGAAGGESETVSKANTATNGGGVYVKADGTGKANAEVLSGNIWYNKATNGGGIYLAEGDGDFRLNGADASISHNTATDGGGIYLYKNPLLNHGKIEQNTAGENGGGMFISGCLVTLKPENDVTITQNNAKNGAGIYISGSTESSGDSSGAESPGGSGSSEGVDATSSPSPDHKVGLLVAFGFKGTVKFTNNKAEVNGGAVCVNAGRFQLESDRITVTGNEAENGGGVAVLQGNFTMSAGAIGEKDGANTATNGGGVYVSNGEVWLKGGNVQYNEAADGGGAYVTGGKFYMIDGFLANNTANADTGNGGGAYVAGDFRMQGGDYRRRR